MTNVLLTSAGRRSYLVRYFKETLGGAGRVICANIYPDTPAMCAADEAVVVPPSSHADYIPTLVDLCESRQVKLISSFHDLDVFILSQHLEALRATGATPIVPDAEWGRICLDKYECSRRMEEVGIDVPWTGVSLDGALEAIAGGELRYPVLVKARLGFGSLGLNLCRTEEQLVASFHATQRDVGKFDTDAFVPCPADERVLIQQAIEGNEYCVDVVNDLDGNYATHLACHVHAMRAGETDSVTTVDPSVVGDMPQRLSALTRHPGIWGVDVMDDRGVGRVIDINPRFTGDYPFHQIAGANIPAALIAWARGEQPDPAWLTAEVGVRGYKDLVPTRVDRSTARCGQADER